MEVLNFIDQLKEFASNEDVLAVGRDVTELRSKFDDYILEEEERERRGSNSSGGSGSSSRRTGGNGGPSLLGNSDDLARTSQMLSKLARVAEAGFNANSRDREA